MLTEDIIERAAVISLLTAGKNEHETEASLDELERLLETAGGHAFVRLVQNRETPDVRTYLGQGKIRELKELCGANGINLVVADDELSPSQIRNMEDMLDDGENEIRVIDRSMLILDIFALHAQTAEGRLQVELAQLKYTAPRLTGKGLVLSRQGGSGGSIATRGPGETKLESDRRIIRKKMTALEGELENIEKRRATQKKARERAGICRVSIVGYTNAGKSTLLNRLTDAGILAEDKLFATLEPTTRRFTLPDGNEILLSDTVGFIRNLPHHLIKAFRSTLDEAADADIIIILADAHDGEVGAQLDVTAGLLKELGAENKPMMCVFNKCDLDGDSIPEKPGFADPENVFYISAKSGQGIEPMIQRLNFLVSQGSATVTLEIPLTRQDVVAGLYRNAVVESVEYGENITVVAKCDEKARGMYREWIKRS